MAAKHSPVQPQPIEPLHYQSDSASVSKSPPVPTNETTKSSGFPIQLPKRAPSILHRFSIIDLQHAIGNRSTVQILQPPSPPVIHRKTVLSGAGNFRLPDADGVEHMLSVAGPVC